MPQPGIEPEAIAISNMEGNNVTTTPPGQNKWGVVNYYPKVLPAGLEPATSAWLINHARADEGVKPRWA